MSITRQRSSARLSQSVIHNNTVYLTGQVAAPGEGVARQTSAALAAIDDLLLAAGTDRSRILQATIWLASIDDFEEMNSVWDSWVDPSAPPVRATCEARLLLPEYKVEIIIIAAKD